MTKKCLLILAIAASVCGWPNPGRAAEPQQSERVLLRYKFQPGETIRWEVTHRARVRTSVSGTTQTVETVTASTKAWRVLEVQPDGTATFLHIVENVDMRHQISGCQEVRYNSRTDKQAPLGFEDVAKAVGVPLSRVTLDCRGKVITRDRKPLKALAQNEGDITIPMPEEPIAVGHTWSFPHEVEVVGNNGVISRIKTLQRFKLLSVQTGVATIGVSTQVLTPVSDPALESQLMQLATSGTVRFDVDAGRILSQQMELDKQVVGFRGPTSSVHYVTRFTEQLLPSQPSDKQQAQLSYSRLVPKAAFGRNQSDLLEGRATPRP